MTPPRALATEAPQSPLSLRDPAGFVVVRGDRVFRFVRDSHLPTLDAWEATAEVTALRREGKLVGSRALTPEELRALSSVLPFTSGGRWLEHPAVKFVSYPQEWAAPLLYDAAELTLELGHRFLSTPFRLKDATPYNVLFEGARPLFVDLLSFEARPATESSWAPFAQFLRTFVHPLMAASRLHLPLGSIFLNSREGLEVEALYDLCGPWRRWWPSYFFSVTLPTLLGRRQARRLEEASVYRPRHQRDAEAARLVLRGLLGYLGRRLRAVAPRSRRSVWSDYDGSGFSYSPAEAEAKQHWVQNWLERHRPLSVLDIGCNTGRYSVMAARSGARVVALDADPEVVGRVYLRAKAEGLAVLPLVVNLARPTPALGWRNAEQSSFLSRAQGKFDGVLGLAVLHHLLVGEGIPMAEVVELLWTLGPKRLCLEFVTPEDRAFQALCRGRDFSHLTRAAFDEALAPYFSVEQCSRVLQSHRWLYDLRRV